MVNIEENHPLGRLFDLDVLMLDQNNEVQGKSRTKLGLPVRRCFLCERPAKDCGRSRRILFWSYKKKYPIESKIILKINHLIDAQAITV
ncbi:citrate lyase holo-[acyl-carrier protein] synthase [Carnobacteriaceae bacterium 52-44]